MTHLQIIKGFSPDFKWRLRYKSATIISGRTVCDGLGVPGYSSTAQSGTHKDSLANTDGEDEADSRRLVRGRGIDDRWRRIEGSRIIAGLIVVHSSAVLVPVAIIISLTSVISAEGRCDQCAADH